MYLPQMKTYNLYIIETESTLFMKKKTFLILLYYNTIFRYMLYNVYTFYIVQH